MEETYIMSVKWAGNSHYEEYYKGTEDECDKKREELENDFNDPENGSDDEESEIRIMKK